MWVSCLLLAACFLGDGKARMRAGAGAGAGAAGRITVLECWPLFGGNSLAFPPGGGRELVERKVGIYTYKYICVCVVVS